MVSRTSTRAALTEGSSQAAGCCHPAQLPETRQPRRLTAAVKLAVPLGSGSAASSTAGGSVSEPAVRNGCGLSTDDITPDERQPAHQSAMGQRSAAPPGPPHDGSSASMSSGSGGGATNMHDGPAEPGALAPPAARLAQLHAALLGCSTAVAVSAELAVLVHLLALLGDERSGGRDDGVAVCRGGAPPLISAAAAAAYACAVLQASGAPGRVHAAG